MKSVIRMQKLSHFYSAGPSRRQVLHELDADFLAGEIVILTGPSGSGKTTILTLAGGLRSVTHGSLQTLDQELNGASPEVLLGVRRRIGFVFQTHNLLGSLTACQNVQMAFEMDRSLSQRAARDRCIELLSAVALTNEIDKYPHQLSGGERQRVAVARALVNRPRLILADEPTAALDKKSGREVVDILYSLAKKEGAAILLVTHDNRILDIADRILTLEDGRLTSFTSGMTSNAGRMLSAYSQMQRKGELSRRLLSLSDEQFLQFLQEATLEYESFLNTLDVANQDAAEALFDQVLASVTLRIRTWLKAERATVYLVDEAKDELYSKVADHAGEIPHGIRIPKDQGIAGHVLATGEVLNVADAYESPFFFPKIDRETGYKTRSVLCIPIRDRAKRIFAIAQLLNKEGGEPFTADDEARFNAFAGPLGIILESGCRFGLRP